MVNAAVLSVYKMVVACDITIHGKQHALVVIFPNALYLLPDETLATVNSHLVWCNSCDAFRAGEAIDNRESVEILLAQSMCGELPEEYIFAFQDDPIQIGNFRESLKRTLHWMDFRTSPAQCLTCHSTSIIHSRAQNEEFVDGRGRIASYTLMGASTSIDHRLTLYDLECKYLGEISRICPETSKFIDDAYEYSKIKVMLDQQK